MKGLHWAFTLHLSSHPSSFFLSPSSQALFPLYILLSLSHQRIGRRRLQGIKEYIKKSRQEENVLTKSFETATYFERTTHLFNIELLFFFFFRDRTNFSLFFFYHCLVIVDSGTAHCTIKFPFAQTHPCFYTFRFLSCQFRDTVTIMHSNINLSLPQFLLVYRAFKHCGLYIQTPIRSKAFISIHRSFFPSSFQQLAATLTIFIMHSNGPPQLLIVSL